MRTYVPDQWLRHWFVGGIDSVSYSTTGQLPHGSPGVFSEELRTVWRNVLSMCREDANLIIHFGAINDRKAQPLDILKDSLAGSGWCLKSIASAGTAWRGKRQAEHFLPQGSLALTEYDIRAVRDST